ncbi:hypothetical protein [Aliarcobacter butzleri]|uniref:hypothetical protein n=1 Tax=Aliarcobacter butzleri TaxID=28197 RepID=UPI002B251552|nr:hypothetical protein [Aliarcobacter butzleri]
MFTDKENLEDLTNDDLDKYLVEITADKSTLEACSNKLFDLVRRYVDKKNEMVIEKIGKDCRKLGTVFPEPSTHKL